MESELSIRVIGTSGKEGKGESQFAQPRGVCIDPRTKELFVVDCNNHRIQVFHLSSLAFIRQIGKGVQGSSPGSLNYAVGICMDDVNQIFVADTNNHRVSVFNHITGGFIRLISSHGSANGYLSSPYGVCVDIYSGMLYVADYDNHRVQVFDKETGDFVRIIGSGFGSAPGQMNQPIVVAIDGETNYLFVADYSNNRVQVFDKDSGVYICSIGNEPGPNCLHGPRGLCINKESNLLFVSDRENHRIQVFDKNTLLFIRHLGQGVGTLLGQFNRPMELCANTEEGVLIAVDGYNHRVQIMELPELVFERQKYRAAMKAKVEAEMKSGSTPRPSLLAVSTDLLTQSVLEIQSESGEGILKFPQYSSVYEMVLNKSDVELLKAYFEANDFANKIKLHASRLNRVSKAEESDSTTHDRKVEMLKKQADTYITILKELAISSKNEDFSMVVPALCALHSTIERNYTPEYMPHEVIELLIDFIANLDDGINSEDERPRVIDAIVALMRQSLSIGKDVEETVLSATLSGLSRPIRYSTEKNGVYESECSDAFGKSDNFDVLLAYYNILADIHTYQKRNSCAKLGEKQMVTGHSNLLYLRDPIDKDRLLSPLSIEKRRQVLCSQVLNFVFGYKFVSKLDKIRTSRVRGVGQPLKFAKITLPVSNTGDFMAGTNGNSVNETTDQSNLKGDSLIIVPDNQSVLLDIVYRINSHRGASSVHNPIILDLQLQLFDEAIKYFANVALNSGDNVVSSSSLPRTSRGGRNIWRPDEPLAVGDLVDAMDKEKSWFESIIQEVYPDNSIKVHFMGWGAKWDDVITNTEISSRLAPLNSKTKNWREDLFEGGLIEIKCNDDLVNQKWMWGKITKLNREEAWVEVSYSFSNEPLVVKRAWLFGETICPVGMHTKDKSKGAAALLVKPHKKVIRLKLEF